MARQDGFWGGGGGDSLTTDIKVWRVDVTKKKKKKERKRLVDFFFHFDFAISRAAFIRGDNVRRGSDNLKKGCCQKKVSMMLVSKKEQDRTNLQKLCSIGPLLGIHLQSLGEVIAKEGR